MRPRRWRGAGEAVADTTAKPDLRQLAALLLRLGMDADALPLLTRTATAGQFDDDTRRLLECASRTRSHQLILDTCKALRESGQGDRRLIDCEVDILQQYDRQAAIEILRQHLQRHADDQLARLRLSMLGLLTDQPALVTADVEQLPSVEDAKPGTVGRAVVWVLQHSGKDWDALPYAYAMLRRNMDDPEAHLIYCNVLLMGEKKRWPFDVLNGVEAGLKVVYQEAGDVESRWLVIEEDEPDADANEYPPDHPRVKAMMGKKPGETFILAAVAVQQRTAKVVELMSKYVYRFQDSIAQFQVRFPDRGDLQQMRFENKGPAGEEQLDFSPFFAWAEKRREQFAQVLGIYRKQPTPIAVLTGFIGRNVFDTMETLVSDATLGMRWCFQPVASEWDDAARAFRANKTVVLDMIALYTLWKLGIVDRAHSKNVLMPLRHSFLWYLGVVAPAV